VIAHDDNVWVEMTQAELEDYLKNERECGFVRGALTACILIYGGFIIAKLIF
jgi:hypothetical protein